MENDFVIQESKGYFEMVWDEQLQSYKHGRFIEYELTDEKEGEPIILVEGEVLVHSQQK